MNALVDRRSTAGIILVVLGLMFLAAQWFDFTGAAVLGVLSVFFLVITSNISPTCGDVA